MTSPFRSGSRLFGGSASTGDRSSATRRTTRVPTTVPGASRSVGAGADRAVDVTTFGGDARPTSPAKATRPPTRRERLERAYRDSFVEPENTPSKARERWLKKMREGAAQGGGDEQADAPPPKDKKDKKDKDKKDKLHDEDGNGKKGGSKHSHHDTVWSHGPGGPAWWKCDLWKHSFHGPLAYAYPPSCGWYPNWFGFAPCWSPSWWCDWWPLYSVHPGYVHCVPTYVPVYVGDTIVYSPYDEVGGAEAFVAAEGELPPETVDPLLEAELLRLASIEDAVAFLEEGARWFQEGRYLEATDAFRRAMLAAPDNAVPKFAMANGLFALGEYGYAAFLLRRGLEILPTWPSAGPDLRDLYGDQDDLLEHQIALEVTAESLPDDADLRLLNGYVAFFTGDLDTAEREFRALLALVPGDAFAGAFLGRIAEIDRLLDAHGVSAEGFESAPAPAPAGASGG